MKHLLLIAAVLLNLSFLSAQDSDKGFTSLFDGKTLKGWKVTDENPTSFLVEDGAIVARGPRAHLFYMGADGQADYKNFELKLKARTTPGSNSGIYFHTEYQKSGWPGLGFEAQVNSTHSDPRKTGSLYGVVNIWAPEKVDENFVVKVDKNREVFILKPSAPSKDNEWFDYHITVKDKHIVIRINGEIQVDWTQPDDWSKDRRIGHGTIGFQAHDPQSEAHFKDIKIKVLD
ncbi:MAG: DUF1080 domain-containing protein [Bacteroidetes bacterium]|nr:DUF1080 domain-containing protein [Bacteroidota bacterium]MCB0846805.1 DUF1080 domain-containing protein [Bacteroidota bacterium]MCB0854403.1 DUF1080 domain-containing protein [Bacteroidota bacterium]